MDIPKPLTTQSLTTGGKSKCCGARQIRKADLSVHSQIRQPPDHDDHPSWRINYTPGPQRGGGVFCVLGGSSEKTAPPRVDHPPGAKNKAVFGALSIANYLKQFPYMVRRRDLRHHFNGYRKVTGGVPVL